MLALVVFQLLQPSELLPQPIVFELDIDLGLENLFDFRVPLRDAVQRVPLQLIDFPEVRTFLQLHFIDVRCNLLNLRCDALDLLEVLLLGHF